MSLARFQLPYMTTAERVAIIPVDRDLVYDTDEKIIYVGDGVTYGGNAINSGTPDWGNVVITGGTVANVSVSYSTLSTNNNINAGYF